MSTSTNFEPYQKGYLDVGNGHQLYYQLNGNPNGIPVVFLYGGPGAGFSDGELFMIFPNFQFVNT